ncbi:chromate efflux transporter [Phenylobacterium sp. LH3H17]|uniref:chromate efflux transporter n=1 Tax=Phenylobacterium sp. LH3H17 TaxID=2903901 RepID=UPI0020C96451|nr:chromate transporter [Phenylobacterium sp. LH3H17]UTP40397.1 chromate efflux transporter [Phenylobacterium sp. LH3H17]
MTEPPVLPSFWAAARVWARIGLLSFGGPAGQIALMHKVLVEERGWIGERRFLHALNYCMLLPGPEAQQLATYVGWLMHRTAGGLLAGIFFVLPGAVVMLALSILYVVYGATPVAEGLFLGVKCAVLAIVTEAVLRVGRRALKSRAALAVAVAAFLGLFVLNVPFPLVVALAAALGWAAPGLFGGGANGHDIDHETPGLVDRIIARGEAPHLVPSRGRALRVAAIWLPIWLAPVAVLFALFGEASVWTKIAGFFSTMGVVTFGGAYAVLTYVAQAAVDGFGWLSPGEMADGLGLAETTPGPLIMVLQFVGFLAAYRNAGGLDPLLAGCLGALLTTWVTFAPSFLWIFVGAPYAEALRGHQAAGAALAAISAAVVGVIANLAVWFALHVLFRRVVELGGVDLPDLASLDWRAAVLTVAAMLAMLRFELGLVPTLMACALGGLALSAVAGV